MDVFERRRQKLAEILAYGMKQSELSLRSGVSASYISRALKEPGERGYKSIGELTARKLEAGAGKKEGWLDGLEKIRPLALIRCKECSAEVSDKATACPKCGAPVPKTQEAAVALTWLGAFVVFAFVVWHNFNAAASRPPPEPPPVAAKTENTKPTKPPKPPPDLSKPLYTNDRAVVCDTGLLTDPRKGYGLDGLRDALDSVFGYDEKLKKIGCERWQSGIPLYVVPGWRPNDVIVDVTTGPGRTGRELLAFNWGLKNAIFDDTTGGASAAPSVEAASAPAMDAAPPRRLPGRQCIPAQRLPGSNHRAAKPVGPAPPCGRPWPRRS